MDLKQKERQSNWQSFLKGKGSKPKTGRCLVRLLVTVGWALILYAQVQGGVQSSGCRCGRLLHTAYKAVVMQHARALAEAGMHCGTLQVSEIDWGPGLHLSAV